MQSFISRYWLSFILVFMLTVLLYQNFFINQFPFSLMEKQSIIDKEVRNNQHIKQKNKIKNIELKAVNATDREILESQARYRFGLIKKGERYYQVND
ncbi:MULTISPECIES: FtsB family cell division protein [sulfur-oxidizing symbionts]|nr:MULTISPECIES: septum formation initiator family protein [sulfur-oxidizing symbionts]